MEDKKEPIKVILADDDKDDQQVFEEAINETAIPVDLTTADNGQELMDNLHDPSIPNPDIIFLDMNMPLKNGKECLEEIKNDEDLKDIPCIMYTTSTSDKDIEETYKAGAHLYVPKPTLFSSIVKILKKILRLNWKEFIKKPIKSFVVSEQNIVKNKDQNN